MHKTIIHTGIVKTKHLQNRRTAVRRWLALVPILTLCLAALGCDNGQSSQLAPTQRVIESDSICRDCIDVVPVARVGDENEGTLFGVMYAALDTLGNYWVSQADGPKVFASDGSFLRHIGREGQGPGEFASPGRIFVGPSDMIHVLDGENRRISSYDHEFNLVGTRRVPPMSQDVLEVPHSDLLVFNGRFFSEDLYAFPLHLLRDTTYVSSFGLPGQGTMRLSLQRRFTADSVGHIYTTTPSEYLITMWDLEGRPLVRLERPGLWESDVRNPGPMTDTNPPAMNIIEIRVDGGGDRLQVLAWLPREDWSDGIEEVQFPDGQIAHMPINNDPSHVMYAVLETIDLNGPEIISQTRLDVLPGGFLSDDLLYGMITDPGTLVPRLGIWRLQEGT